MSRREAREIAFKLIFSYEFDKQSQTEQYDEYVAGLNPDDLSYVSVAYQGAISHYDEIKQEVEKYADNFAIDRIYKVDMAILVLAIYEIKYIDTIPFKVSVDEALKLAEVYSTEKSVKFINGILSKFGGKNEDNNIIC